MSDLLLPMYLDFTSYRDAPRSLRYATYYQTENGTDYRKLIKAYGILFKMDVIGEVCFNPPMLASISV